jgi:putative hemolysin
MLELLLLLICIVGSGFASGSEMALVSASRIRLRHLASQGFTRANTALGLLDQKERTLVATLIATNVFNIAGGAISTVALHRWVGSLAPLVATVAMTSVLLVLGEIVPKAYFRYHAEQALIHAAIIWKLLCWIMAPITFPISVATNLLFRLFRSRPKSLYTTREEIKMVLEESVESGGLRKHQQEMLESALNYATTIVREVMVPISDVALIPETGRTEELLALVREQGHTRIPVYRDRVDQIVAFVNVFDIFFDENRKTFIRPYMRQAPLVPDTKRIDELFVELQRNRESLAIVVNEFGACFGIVTLEDIIEEIFGELTDEHENHVPEIEQKGPGRFRVSGSTDVDDLRAETGMTIKKAGFETVGGYVLHHLGRIPRKGETFTDGNRQVRILEADRYSVKMIEVIQKNEDHVA